MQEENIVLTLSTVPSKEVAEKIANTVLEERLAACVNIIPGISSIYTWESKIEKSEELLLIIKGRMSDYKKLEQRLLELHPYQIPAALCLEAKEVNKAYRDWLLANCDVAVK